MSLGSVGNPAVLREGSIVADQFTVYRRASDRGISQNHIREAIFVRVQHRCQDFAQTGLVWATWWSQGSEERREKRCDSDRGAAVVETTFFYVSIVDM